MKHKSGCSFAGATALALCLLPFCLTAEASDMAGSSTVYSSNGIIDASWAGASEPRLDGMAAGY